MGDPFGIETAPAARARVLELGCGAGLNKSTFAARHPKSECGGVDLSRSAIEQGRAATGVLTLNNLALSRGDIGDTEHYHEYLDVTNHPVYFHEFATNIAGYGLKYLWDTDVDSGVVDNLPPEVAGRHRVRPSVEGRRHRRLR